MLERHVEVNNPLGLHARAAAHLVRLANRFRSTVTVHRNDNGVTANAKSILSLLHVAAAYGTVVTIVVEGDDEAEAIDAIEKLFLQGFGEI